MKKLNILYLLLILFWSQCINAQSFNLEKFNTEKEKILNVVINSVEFDSIYSSKRVYFVSNELLSTTSLLILKRGNCRVKIVEREELLKKQKDYVGLGDFTMPKENPTTVRVQVYSSSTKKMLNLRLVKKDDDWVIENHVIFED